MRRALMLAGIVATICVVAGAARTQQIRDAALKTAALRYVENGHGVPYPYPAPSTHAALKAAPGRAGAAPG